MSNHALNRDDGAYICQRNTCISLADDVIPWVFKKPHCNFRSPLMKTLKTGVSKRWVLIPNTKSLLAGSFLPAEVEVLFLN